MGGDKDVLCEAHVPWQSSRQVFSLTVSLSLELLMFCITTNLRAENPRIGQTRLSGLFELLLDVGLGSPSWALLAESAATSDRQRLPLGGGVIMEHLRKEGRGPFRLGNHVVGT